MRGTILSAHLTARPQGYAKKKSVPSLVGGLAFGAGYAFTAYTIQVRYRAGEIAETTDLTDLEKRTFCTTDRSPPRPARAQNTDAVSGHMYGAVISLGMLGMMGSRFAKTKKFMPAGLLATSGALASGFHLMKYRQWAS